MVKRNFSKDQTTLECPIQRAAIFELNVRAPGLFIFSSLSGGSRDKREAANLKLQGSKPGIPDLFVLYPRCGYHGLMIEVKKSDGVVSTAQKKVHRFLSNEGYLVMVLRTADEIVKTVLDYIGENYQTINLN